MKFNIEQFRLPPRDLAAEATERAKHQASFAAMTKQNQEASMEIEREEAQEIAREIMSEEEQPDDEAEDN